MDAETVRRHCETLIYLGPKKLDQGLILFWLNISFAPAYLCKWQKWIQLMAFWYAKWLWSIATRARGWDSHDFCALQLLLAMQCIRTHTTEILSQGNEEIISELHKSSDWFHCIIHTHCGRFLPWHVINNLNYYHFCREVMSSEHNGTIKMSATKDAGKIKTNNKPYNRTSSDTCLTQKINACSHLSVISIIIIPLMLSGWVTDLVLPLFFAFKLH